MPIVRSTRNSESGSLHAAMSATMPQTLETLAKKAGVSLARASEHCDFWSKPQPSRDVHQPAYLWKDGGWILAPGVRIQFR
jgi:hypothetical protein